MFWYWWLIIPVISWFGAWAFYGVYLAVTGQPLPSKFEKPFSRETKKHDNNRSM